jgi:hypothetical protein
MPRAMNPDATVDIVLESDQGLENPPTFVFKAITVRDEEQIGQLYDRAISEEKNQLSELIIEYLQPLLRGFRNMGSWNFAEHTLADILCGTEAFELARLLLASGRLDYEEKKRSVLDASSVGESFVKAAAEVATKTTAESK